MFHLNVLCLNCKESRQYIIMMNSFNLFVIMLLLRNVTSKQLEPTCSKFHFEEQLLAKAVKLENTIDDFIQQSGETTTEVKSNLERLEIEINQLKARLDKYDNEDGKIFEFVCAKSWSF